METLNIVGQVAALVGAVVLILVAPVEMFLYGRTWVARFLGVEARHVAEVRLWAFCIGARNLLAGLGVLIGLFWIHGGQEQTGTIVVLVCSWYMLLSSLAMAAADALGYWKPRGGSIMGTIGSSIPPLVVILSPLWW